jgi:hypothetical protein
MTMDSLGSRAARWGLAVLDVALRTAKEGWCARLRFID